MNHEIGNGRPRRRLFFGLVCAAAFSWAGASVAGGQSAATTWDGVYSEAQAKQGETVFSGFCAECHGADLTGREQAPALAGLGFTDKWNKATVRKLLEQVEQMPPDQPKTLTPQQYVDVVAYLLSANDFPAGTTALPVDRPTLGHIEIRNVRPPK